MARIVVAEDDVMFGAALVEALRIAGHDVRLADNGLSAMRVIAEGGTDLFITDLVMPGQEGIETIMELRVKHPKLPIIAISGDVENSPMYLQLAAKLGARKTLRKPFALSTLIESANEVLGSV